LTYLPFNEIDRAALVGGRSLVARLIPGGKFRGREYVVRNPRRNDDRPGSFKVNYRTGVWADFATTDKGGDLISLLAYLKGLEQGEAARELADVVGYSLPQTNGFANGNGPCDPLPIKVDPVEESRGIEISTPSYPAQTPPSADGRPKFFVGGDDGPRVAPDELRRHVYRRHGNPVRIKLKFRSGHFANWYRVADVNGAAGWQSEKPQGYVDVPFVGAINPFEPELGSEPVFWPEGEKDCDTLGLLYLPAFTFGGTGDGLPQGCKRWIADRDVVILADNDSGGREHAQHKAKLAHPIAKSVKVIEFQGLPPKGDITDWLAQGHTADELTALANAARPWKPLLSELTDVPQAGNAGLSLWWHGEADPNTDRTWLIEGLLPEIGTAIMAGPWGSYKTFVALDLGRCLSCVWSLSPAGRSTSAAACCSLRPKEPSRYRSDFKAHTRRSVTPILRCHLPGPINAPDCSTAMHRQSSTRRRKKLRIKSDQNTGSSLG
jgi:hypothetical protein